VIFIFFFPRGLGQRGFGGISVISSSGIGFAFDTCDDLLEFAGCLKAWWPRGQAHMLYIVFLCYCNTFYLYDTGIKVLV